MSAKIEISSERDRLDIEQIHSYISNRSYWGRGRTLEQVKASIEHSICFGAYVDGTFGGFTRVVSDRVTFAYVLDLFVLEDFRGHRVSRALIEAMLRHEELQTVDWMLGTKDAHGLYQKYGFQRITDTNRYMGRLSGPHRA